MKKVKENITGVVTVLLLVLNTLFWASFLFPIAVLKIIPVKIWRKFINNILDTIACCWIYCNNAGLKMTRTIHWDVSGVENLSKKSWYIVIANHQSWTDIVVLQKILTGKIPFLKFFLKKELIWVPVLGLAWWALDFPFMRRYSQSFLLKYPHLKGKDIEVTKKACQKFKYIPVSIMNFVEGTRFTPEKHAKQESPYKNLLKPKSGGIGFVFSTMGNMITSILDVTIVYPQGRMSFWDFLCGRVNVIKVHVEEIPVTDDFIGDYVDDPVFKNKFQQWLNDLWYEKDIRIDMLKGKSLPLSAKPYAEDEAMIIN
ncbi:MAG TPA: acyltransferase [Spirochaetota bacterium]|nr:acyltransferase [Spirochaetota bacterium]